MSAFNLPCGVTMRDIDPGHPDISELLADKTDADLFDILNRNCIPYYEGDDLVEAVTEAFEIGKLDLEDIV